MNEIQIFFWFLIIANLVLTSLLAWQVHLKEKYRNEGDTLSREWAKAAIAFRDWKKALEAELWQITDDAYQLTERNRELTHLLDTTGSQLNAARHELSILKHQNLDDLPI